MDESEFYRGIDPLWALHDELSILDAAALIAGFDPVHFELNGLGQVFTRSELQDFKAVEIAFRAIKNAILSRKLKATIRCKARDYGYTEQMYDIEMNEALFEKGFGRSAEEDEIFSEEHSCFYNPNPDWEMSTVDRDDLIEWIKSRGKLIRPGFFFDTESSDPDYMDRNHPRYSAKLAASIKVWLAMEDPELTSGKSIISSMEDWLRSRYKELDLVHEGTMNKTAISECAKIANWNTKGGATKTPGSDNPPTP